MSSHELDFDRKVVVITGGGGGIGKAAAAAFSTRAPPSSSRVAVWRCSSVARRELDPPTIASRSSPAT